MNFLKSRKGFGTIGVVLIIVLSVTIAGAGYFVWTTSRGKSAFWTSNMDVARYVAESAIEKCIIQIQIDMNDEKSFEMEFWNISKFIKSWYGKFRIPLPTVDTGIGGGFGTGSGIDVGLNIDGGGVLGSNKLEDEYDINDGDPLKLKGIIAKIEKDVGGKITRCFVKAKINSAYGIRSTDPLFTIPGINFNISKQLNDIVGKLTEKMPKISLTSFLSDTKLTDVINVNVGGMFGELLKTFGLDINKLIAGIFEKFLGGSNSPLNLKTLVDNLLTKVLGMKPEIDTGKYVKDILDKYLISKLDIGNIYPTNIDLSVEKFGTILIESDVIYENNGRKYHKTIVAEKEYKVADCQPPCPLFTSFIWNKTDKAIDFNKGGYVFFNNFNWMTMINTLTKLGDPLKAMNEITWPGLLRVNGKKESWVALDFMNSNATVKDALNWSKGDDSRKDIPYASLGLLQLLGENKKKIDTGVASRWMFGTKPPKSKDGRSVIPTLSVTMGSSDSPDKIEKWSEIHQWDWPCISMNKGMCAIPSLSNSKSKTNFFGYFSISPPIELQGNLYKQYERWYWQLCIPAYNYKQIMPVPLLYWTPQFTPYIPIIRLIMPWGNEIIDKSYASTYKEPYGFSRVGMLKNLVDTKGYDPKDPENFPDNLPDISMFEKKCSYLYENDAAWQEDLKKRLEETGNEYLDLRGINFIKGGCKIPAMKVSGRGMIVSDGDITIEGDIRQMNEGSDVDTFSIMARKTKVKNSGDNVVFGHIYSEKGIAGSGQLKIVGNYVCNDHSVADGVKLIVEYNAAEARCHLLVYVPIAGKYVPQRFWVSMSKAYSKWYDKDE